MERWTAASLLVVTAFFGWVSRLPIVAGVVAAMLLVPLLTRLRVPLGKNAARVATGAAAVVGGIVGSIVNSPRGFDILQKPWPAFVLAGLFAGVAQLVIAPVLTEGDRTRARPTPFALLPGLVAIMACGEARIGSIYGVAVALWLALALAGLHTGDPSRVSFMDLPRRRRLAALALLGIGVGIAAGSVAGLPPLSRWMERRIMRALGGAETGFSDRMWLGSLDGLLDSDEVVMRIEGPHVDYLRGAVFDHYEIGRWGHMKQPRVARVEASPSDAVEGDERVHLSVVAGARDRYFLPLGASAVNAPGATLAVNRYGILRVVEGVASEASFAVSGPPAFELEPPTDDDLDVPPALQRPLKRLATKWTQGAVTNGEKVSAILRELRGFTYARTFQRRRSDPILDFLFDDRRGHCEYFATATALVARSAGVPARVVAGYRVAEENAVGKYWVVREKNAHAWTEVWIPEKGFVTVDATPADPLAQNAPHRSSWLRSVLDLASVWASRAIARITLLHLVYAGLGFIAVALVVRRLQMLPGGRRGRAARERAEPPPPSLLRLLDALAKRGTARGDAEPIERFASRIEGEGEAGEAAALLHRWAALRYGGIGDGDALARESDACAERLRRA